MAENSSPLIAEYGRSTCRKNGWKTLNCVSVIPRPCSLDIPTARSIHVVMLSGASADIEALPDSSVITSDHSHVSGKNWRTRRTSARSSEPAAGAAAERAATSANPPDPRGRL